MTYIAFYVDNSGVKKTFEFTSHNTKKDFVRQDAISHATIFFYRKFWVFNKLKMVRLKKNV